MDCSPSGSSVHGILQARILELAVIMIIIIITAIPFYLQYKLGILLTLSNFLINRRIGYHLCDNYIIELTESQGVKI